MTEFYTANSEPEEKKRRPSLRLLVGLIVGIVIIASSTVFVLYQFNRQKLVDQVIFGLQQVPALMEKAKSDAGGAYPATITAEQLPKSDTVDFSGQGGFDGSTYCVTGTSKKDTSIVYYISTSLKQPEKGSCQTAANLPVPNAPGNFAIQVVGTRQASFSWAGTTYAANYTLECSSDADFKSKKYTKIATDTSAICEGLESNTRYYAHVQATNASGGSSWSQVLEFSTPLWSTAPSNVTAKPTSPSSFSYSWDSVPSALEYVVERASDNSFTQDVVTVIIPAGASRSGTFTDLKPDTYYWIHIKAVTPDFDRDHAAFSSVIEVRTLK